MLRFLSKSRSHPAATLIRFMPSIDVSFTALLYFVATLFIGLAAMNSQTNLLFGVFGLMIGVLLVAGYISRFALRRLRVRRAIPDHLVVGAFATVTYHVANAKRYWPSVSVSLGELDGCEAFTRQPYAYLLHVAAGLETVVSAELIPKRRGVHELNRYQVSTRFPFGFIKRAAIYSQKEKIVVFPALGQVDPNVLRLCQSAEKAGAPMRPRKGGQDEFYGIKEYRTGENPRWIYWKRSARTGVLVCREMSHVSPPRLLLVLDTFRDCESAHTSADVERAIAMAASLASSGLEQGHPIGLFVWSGDYVHIPAKTGKRQRREILTALSVLDANANRPLEDLLSAAVPVLETGTTLVVISPQTLHHHLLDRHHKEIISLSSTDANTSGWFLFARSVEFAHCMPTDQESSDFLPAPKTFGESSRIG